jgi:hypothetical protein
MSFVGRDQVGEYVKLFKSDYRKLLSTPGITDPVSLKYLMKKLFAVCQRSQDIYEQDTGNLSLLNHR